MSPSESQMNVMDAIHERQSVRSYSPKRVNRTTIRTLLEAAVRAPTAVHEEPWAFVIVQDTALLRSLSDRAKKIFAADAERAHPDQARHLLDMLAKPDFNIFYDAGTLIIICARPKGAFVTADCWLAAETHARRLCHGTWFLRDRFCRAGAEHAGNQSRAGNPRRMQRRRADHRRCAERRKAAHHPKGAGHPSVEVVEGKRGIPCQ